MGWCVILHLWIEQHVMEVFQVTSNPSSKHSPRMYHVMVF